jgi:hypothetical protein
MVRAFLLLKYLNTVSSTWCPCSLAINVSLNRCRLFYEVLQSADIVCLGVFTSFSKLYYTHFLSSGAHTRLSLVQLAWKEAEEAAQAQ